MLNTYQKNLIKSEIKYNIREVYWHAIFTFKLIGRLLRKAVHRSPATVVGEYEPCWDNFWDNKNYFSNDKYPFVENGRLINPMISPFQYQMEVTDKKIADYIVKHNCKTILEVGSGTGLHLLNLAAIFPDVEFVGVELTNSGVEISKKLLENPPAEFALAHQKGRLSNVKIIQGDILSDKTIADLKLYQFDLIFSTTVLEQLNNYLDVVMSNLFKLNFNYFIFHEQWFDLNADVSKYRLLLESDYFRAPLSILNGYPARILETILPSRQPMGMNLAVVFGEKTSAA